MDPFWGPRDATSFSKKFLQCKLDMKIQLAAKFGENLMNGYPALVRTDGRTDGETDKQTDGNDYYSPFPNKVGTKKKRK